MSYWSEKVVLVTGGSAGLGLALGRAYSKAGAKVILMSRSQKQLEKAAESLGGQAKGVFVIAGDITKQEDVEYVIRRIARGHLSLIHI